MGDSFRWFLCIESDASVVKYFHVCVVSGECVAAPPEEDMLNLYCKIRAITSPPNNWNFFLALNMFSLASFVQVKRDCRKQNGVAAVKRSRIFLLNSH